MKAKRAAQLRVTPKPRRPRAPRPKKGIAPHLTDAARYSIYYTGKFYPGFYP